MRSVVERGMGMGMGMGRLVVSMVSNGVEERRYMSYLGRDGQLFGCSACSTNRWV
jgi:hypothetical protein